MMTCYKMAIWGHMTSPFFYGYKSFVLELHFPIKQRTKNVINKIEKKTELPMT